MWQYEYVIKGRNTRIQTLVVNQHKFYVKQSLYTVAINMLLTWERSLLRRVWCSISPVRIVGDLQKGLASNTTVSCCILLGFVLLDRCVFCVMLYRSFFVLCLLAIVLSDLLWRTASDYPFAMFKLFLTSDPFVCMKLTTSVANKYHHGLNNVMSDRLTRTYHSSLTHYWSLYHVPYHIKLHKHGRLNYDKQIFCIFNSHRYIMWNPLRWGLFLNSIIEIDETLYVLGSNHWYVDWSRSI